MRKKSRRERGGEDSHGLLGAIGRAHKANSTGEKLKNLSV